MDIKTGDTVTYLGRAYTVANVPSPGVVVLTNPGEGVFTVPAVIVKKV